MSGRTRWALTDDAFDKLLDALGPDLETASREYEDLRRWLIGVFTWTGTNDPETLADVTLDRAAKRLADGERIDHIRAWIRSAARLVLKESYLSQTRERSSARDAIRIFQPNDTVELDHTCFERCVRGLPPESRSLLDRYYSADRLRLIPARKELARDLGISIETLRTRALRLRKNLERCMLQCRKNSN